MQTHTCMHGQNTCIPTCPLTVSNPLPVSHIYHTSPYWYVWLWNAKALKARLSLLAWMGLIWKCSNSTVLTTGKHTTDACGRSPSISPCAPHLGKPLRKPEDCFSSLSTDTWHQQEIWSRQAPALNQRKGTHQSHPTHGKNQASFALTVLRKFRAP